MLSRLRRIVLAPASFAATCTLMPCAAGAQRAARPSGEAASRWPASVGVTAQLGLGSPLGYAGGAMAWTPLPAFTLEAGAGAGSAGPQLALMGLGRVTRERSAWGFGAGVSGGRYIAGPTCDAFLCDDGSQHARKVWDVALWANAEVFGEWWSEPGRSWFLRPRAGLGVVLNPGAGEKTADICGEVRCDGVSGIPPERLIPYVGLSLGHNWPL